MSLSVIGSPCCALFKRITDRRMGMWESRVLCEMSKSRWKPFCGVHGDAMSTAVFAVTRDRARVSEPAGMPAPRTLRALFSLPGFIASARLKGVFGDRFARIVVLRRRKKRRGARVATIGVEAATISGPSASATSGLPTGGSTLSSSAGACGARGAATCS